MQIKNIIKNKIKPELRFPDFHNEWEQKKIEEIFIKNKERNSSNKYNNVLTNSAVRGIVRQLDYFDKNIANQNNLTNYFIVDINDFIYNPRISKYAPVGPFKRNNIAKGIMSPLYTVLRPKIGDVAFFEKYFETAKWHRYMYKIANYGARHDRMNILQDDFLKMPVPFPSLFEQKKIASFLNLVDGLVVNFKQQKKMMEIYKKGIIQKIFSQDIRFKNKDGVVFPQWKKIKIGEIGEVKTSSVDKKMVDGEKVVNLLNYMDIYSRDHIYKGDKFQKITAKSSQIQSSDLKKGDILFTPSSETPTDIGHSAVVMDDLENVLFSYHLVRLRPIKNILDHKFSAYAFKSFKFYKQLWRKAQGATRFTLSKESLEESIIFIPESILEQQKIANFLSSIDNLIESKEEQIIKIEKWRKGLMQKLFI